MIVLERNFNMKNVVVAIVQHVVLQSQDQNSNNIKNKLNKIYKRIIISVVHVVETFKKNCLLLWNAIINIVMIVYRMFSQEIIFENLFVLINNAIVSIRNKITKILKCNK